MHCGGGKAGGDGKVADVNVGLVAVPGVEVHSEDRVSGYAFAEP